MADIKKSFFDLIGNTPLVELCAIERELGLEAALLAKVERFNPAGSVKDRVAASMLADAEEKGLLRPGATVIEPTSGNTGIGLAAACACKGYRLILTMPETMSVERRQLAAAYGAQIVLTDGALGMQGAIDKAQTLHAEIPGSLIAGQFVNPANPAAHRATTGPELFSQTEGRIDAFVAGVGTGGTLTGVGQYLKERIPGLRVVAVEPSGSPLLSEGRAGKHGLQGIGANFVPDVLDTDIYDEIVAVDDADAYAMGRLLARREGLLCGITSGAALCAAIEIAKRPGFVGKTVVALLPDTGERYLSTPMFSES